MGQDVSHNLDMFLRPLKWCTLVVCRTVAVAEERNARVQLFSARTGRGLGCIDRGAVPGLVGPSALCVSADRNHLLVADCSVVRYFNLNGENNPGF